MNSFLPQNPPRTLETKLLVLAAWDGFWWDGMKKHSDLFIFFTTGLKTETKGGRGFRSGGGGLPSSWERAGNTFWSVKTGFSQSTVMLSCLEPICSLKYLLSMSISWYGPWYCWERGREEASSWKNTNSEFSNALVRGLLGTEWVWWGTGSEKLVMAE